MIVPALLAGLAAWFATPAPATRRLRVVVRHEAPGASLPSLTTLVTVLVPAACLVVMGPVAGLLVAVPATPIARTAAKGALTSAARRRCEQARAQLPGALDLLVAVLGSGRPADVAFEVVAEVTPDPLGPELATVASRLRTAPDVAVVWTTLVPHPVIGPVARAFRRADRSGTPVAGVVAAAAREVRRERMAQARERARAVSVHTAAPLGLCFLPAFFLVGIVPTLVGVGSRLGTLLP